MTFPTTLRTMYIVSAGLDVLGTFKVILYFRDAEFFLCVLYRQRGKALSFVTRENWKWARELCNILAEAEQVHCMYCTLHVGIILYVYMYMYV